MIGWGLVSMGTMFITDVRSFMAARVLLGIAEAGFFPGMILYLTYWIPATDRAQDRRALHDGRPGRGDRRRASVGGAAEARRTPGPQGLAVAVPHRGTACGRARCPLAQGAHRSARRRDLALAPGSRLAGRDDGRRTGAPPGGRPHVAPPQLRERQSVAPLRRVLHEHRCHLRRFLVAAQAAAGRLRRHGVHAQHDYVDSVCRRARGDGRGRTPLGSHG